MGVESYLVLWVFTDGCCHPNRFRVELMLIESFEIGRLDFPKRDTLKSTHCFCLTPELKRCGPPSARELATDIGPPAFAPVILCALFPSSFRTARASGLSTERRTRAEPAATMFLEPQVRLKASSSFALTLPRQCQRTGEACIASMNAGLRAASPSFSQARHRG